MPDRWCVPAKTFLLGEYAALAKKSALILTTTPCFELRVTVEPGLHGIHPASPAGRWWTQAGLKGPGLTWHDPYQGLGGMGASSAQFIAVHQACAHLSGQLVDAERMLDDYFQTTTTPHGTPPSGYDVLAQQSQGCVYINRETATHQELNWPFDDLGFIVLHTRQKIATHQHLQSVVLTKITDHLSDLVEQARNAFTTNVSDQLLQAVKAYHQALSQQGWIAVHSLDMIESLYTKTKALAIKGCGAMGADTLLLLMAAADIASQTVLLQESGWHVLATQGSLYKKSELWIDSLC